MLIRNGFRTPEEGWAVLPDRFQVGVQCSMSQNIERPGNSPTSTKFWMIFAIPTGWCYHLCASSLAHTFIYSGTESGLNWTPVSVRVWTNQAEDWPVPLTRGTNGSLLEIFRLNVDSKRLKVYNSTIHDWSKVTPRDINQSSFQRLTVSWRL